MATISLGPFPVLDVPRIQEILETLKVPYDIRRDETLLDSKEEDSVHSELPGQVVGRLTGTDRYLPAFIFIEIEDSDAPKIGNHLESFGIVLGGLPDDETSN
jgi:hypothetical protein